MKRLWKIYDLSLVFIILAVFFAGMTTSYSLILAVIEFVLVIAFAAGKFIYYKTKREKLLFQISTVSDELDFDKGKAFEKLSVPCSVIEQDGTIIWLNSSFKSYFNIDEHCSYSKIQNFINGADLDKLINGCGYTFTAENMYFAAYSNQITVGDEDVYLLYFFDETALRITEKEYNDTIPSIMLTVIDNADEIYQNFKESECAAIFSKAEQMIEQWVAQFGGLCRKYSNVRMMVFVQQRDLQRMIEDKFTIIDKIRELTFDGKETNLTLSIGIGSEGSLTESNNSARQALDMAQSRGGDQVAHKTGTHYKFYGGVSEGKEKTNKVRVRLVAKSISEFIEGSENVLIMGHRFSDFDSFGSCVGMHCIASHLGKDAKIVLNLSNTLASPLIEKFIEEKGEDIIVSPEQAQALVGENTLLIVTDTHKQEFTEEPSLVDKVDKVVVIDHHRKSVGFIEDTVMFYHMPNSSSTCEMVTELSEYIDKSSIIDKLTALALLSGIMLDTRNFILRAGVRTFGAAAYLRSKGASTIDCKKLFASDMDIFRSRNSIIDEAQQYRNCAVSVSDKPIKNIRLATSQAADEMLNIEGVKASFVIFKSGESVNISARSYGEINVQLIMEQLGGGGHQTMSACQLVGVTVEQAQEMLIKAIDNYYININGG